MDISATGIVVFAAVALFLLAGGLWVGIVVGRRNGFLEAEAGFRERLPAEREQAVRRSRAVIGGQTAEQLAPYLPGFPFDPSEVRFIGKPVDFIAFVGASGGVVEEIAFVEVKSGNADLSAVERSLRDAIEDGRVAWYEYRTP